MAKTKDRTYRQKFMDVFKILTRSRRNWEVWSDFVHLTACTISNVLDISHCDEREEWYMQIISRYTKEESVLFADLMGITVLALEENPRQDFLGQIHQAELELGNAAAGSFYSPYNVGQLMSELSGEDMFSKIMKEEYVMVNDCCCGAGCLLLAFANTVRDKGINYQERVFFIAQDIDSTAAMSCYIQMSLLGCPGYVIVGNTLSNQAPRPENIWYTPFYFHNIWVDRRKMEHWKKVFKILLNAA